MRNLRQVVAIAAASLIVSALAACSGSTPAPTTTSPPSNVPPEPTATDLPTAVPSTATLEPTATSMPIPIPLEDLLGIWSAPGVYLQFRDDGVMWVAGRRVELDNEEPGTEDGYVLEDNRIFFTTFTGDCRNLDGEYQISLTDDGQLEFDEIDEECGARRALETRGPWTRVSD